MKCISHLNLPDAIPTKGARTFSHRLTPSYRALYARGSIFLLVLIREGRKSVPLLVLYLMWLLTQVFLCSIWVITVIAVLYGDVKLNGYLMGIWFLCRFCFHGHQESDGANHGLFSNGGACIC